MCNVMTNILYIFHQLLTGKQHTVMALYLCVTVIFKIILCQSWYGVPDEESDRSLMTCNWHTCTLAQAHSKHAKGIHRHKHLTAKHLHLKRPSLHLLNK